MKDQIREQAIDHIVKEFNLFSYQECILCEMLKESVKPCGLDWAYCGGDCKNCTKSNTITTNTIKYE